MNSLLRLAGVAVLVGACGSAAAAPAAVTPQTITVYATPAPTSQIIYVTPASTEKPTPKPTPRATARPTPAPTPNGDTLAYERLIRAHVPVASRSRCAHTTTLPPLAGRLPGPLAEAMSDRRVLTLA